MWFALAGAVIGCGSVKETPGDAAQIDAPGAMDGPAIDAPPPVEHLYVGNDQPLGGISQYTLPLTATSTINFTFSLANAVDAVFGHNGNLLAADNAGHLFEFTMPLSATSAPAASFTNGTSNSNGQLVVTPAGNLIAATQTATLNVFAPPFSSSSTPTTAITSTTITTGIGAALDAAANLYVSNAVSTGSNLSVFPPPYASATVTTPAVPGTLYRKIAISSTQLFVTSVSSGAGRLDVYNLPLSAGSMPAFSITTGVNAPEAVALDAGGHLYVGNAGDTTVVRYSPPFTAASVPDVTVKVSTGTFAIFGIAVGP